MNKSKEKFCKKCKELLTKSNWYDCLKKSHTYYCKKCWVMIKKKRARERYISLSNGGYVIGNKRKYPKDNKCEVCKRGKPKIKLLVYHHWDTKNFLRGLWLCNKCHMIANGLEYPKLLKRKLTKCMTEINRRLKLWKIT